MTDTGVVLLWVIFVSCTDSLWCRWALASRDRSSEESTRIYAADRTTFEATLLRLLDQLRSIEKQRDDLLGQLNRKWAFEPTPASEVESDDARV